MSYKVRSCMVTAIALVVGLSCAATSSARRSTPPRFSVTFEGSGSYTDMWSGISVSATFSWKNVSSRAIWNGNALLAGNPRASASGAWQVTGANQPGTDNTPCSASGGLTTDDTAEQDGEKRRGDVVFHLVAASRLFEKPRYAPDCTDSNEFWDDWVMQPKNSGPGGREERAGLIFADVRVSLRKLLTKKTIVIPVPLPKIERVTPVYGCTPQNGCANQSYEWKGKLTIKRR